MSTPVFVCVVAVAEEAAEVEGVSLTAMAEAPRVVGGKKKFYSQKLMRRQ